MNKNIHVYMQPRRYGQTYGELIRLTKENEKLKSIIKEANDYIINHSYNLMFELRTSELDKLLHILKGDENE